MWKRISAVLGSLVLLGSLISGYVWFDTRYAKASDVESNRIEIQITQLKNDVRWYQDQMAYIMTRCNKRDPNELPEHAFKNYKDYENKKEELEQQLNILMQKRMGN